MTARLPDDVRSERLGWRDERISRRHREWGYDCPAANLDFVVIEYSLGRPVALVEYKHHNAAEPDMDSPTNRAMRELAGVLPYFVAHYWPDSWAFRLWPGNAAAREHCEDGQAFTERAFVTLLYRLRALAVREHVLAKLSTELPRESAD